MELIACILAMRIDIPMYTINRLCILSKYTARETRPYMRRRVILYAVYKQRLARALIARMHRFAVPYNGKFSHRYVPNPAMFRNHLFTWNIFAPDAPMRAFRDVTIVASASIYMRECTPRCSWLTIDGRRFACVQMTEVIRGSIYKYRMRLPTRVNPICSCCINVNRIGIIIEQDHYGLIPAIDMKNAVKYIKIKFKTNATIRKHESVSTINFHARTFIVDAEHRDNNLSDYLGWSNRDSVIRSHRG